MMSSAVGRETIIELVELTKEFGEGEALVRALRGINVTIKRGEFVAIMGPSGSGKSTCMNVLGCLDRPTSGRYLFAGTDVGQLEAEQLALLRRHYLGFVFQGFNLLGRTTALENVELPLLYRSVPAAQRRQRALKALHEVGLEGRENHTPAELSGGQQQRVAFARAIVSDPVVLLADEPTGNLDTQTSEEIMNLMTDLNQRLGITILMVTHEPEMAGYADRLIVFRDGLVQSDGNVAKAA
ncbi:MAG: ABC transporter ATP-binding protein [Pseudomonadota bacterium]